MHLLINILNINEINSNIIIENNEYNAQKWLLNYY